MLPEVRFPTVRQFNIRRVEEGASLRALDIIVAEEPLEIRVQHWFKDTVVTEPFAITMRTPGSESELAAGLLLTEGVIYRHEDIVSLRLLGSESSNEILVEVSKEVDFESWRMARNGIMSSSCGICGKRSSEAIIQQLPARIEDRLTVPSSLIERLPNLLEAEQAAFAQTGALHAAALVRSSGEIEAVFEDIGRHNALDKLIGWCVLNDRVPLNDRMLFLSSRSSFELVQKAAMAGAPILATIGGSSSLAIKTAREIGLTLVGFIRTGRFNIYSGEWRIHSE
ncbi:MAG: formate dehydrogenase accessory sulfurtransferase FdhD [Acidobacteriaceae bacterium]|nr:formate dehydrogenase accessory sulfurtransferase FdhD [Acidobacteriaceae bacterium]MBV9498806.1 formate dehydrogenase accessory sulfurtransferase FdhD [Acidobacteriaceae bacterium]